MVTRLALSVVLVVILLVATGVLAHADVFLDVIEETRGFNDTVMRAAKCTSWYTTGASVGRATCDDAVFYKVGDSIIRYQDYTMPLDGMVKFSIRRNTGNPGWSWLFIATIIKPNGGSVIRTYSTGASDRGFVFLMKGERLTRIEFQANSAGPRDARIPMVKVWSVATATHQVFLPIVH